MEGYAEGKTKNVLCEIERGMFPFVAFYLGNKIKKDS